LTQFHELGFRLQGFHQLYGTILIEEIQIDQYFSVEMACRSPLKDQVIGKNTFLVSLQTEES